ncbi:putative MobA-like protein [Halobacteroides halobius DSM 5150]|uniref:Putative MobA-like protein n=1 Tax=Halobacteroides halobius (strain ATCC 35273 / DSM 5150 / MD-1) TaxID=748449 RepID=L0K901_HALHC|nr:nucleotidyltransferase family protein [Halobacteroides halobius]AGB41025.1 putative MobA-like protein [Halobacteroides halobius DSM 5150]
MVSAIVLAAGMSTRLDKDKSKQLLSLGKKTIIETVINKLLASEVEEIIVVVGYQAGMIRSLIQSKEVKICYNKDYKLGQSTSLKKGLLSIASNCKAILCVLADQPLVRKETINQLITEFKVEGELIVAPEYKEHRGNPVLFSADLKSEMLKISGDRGARDLIDKYRKQSKLIKVDDQGVIFDVDTKEDYLRLLIKHIYRLL